MNIENMCKKLVRDYYNNRQPLSKISKSDVFIVWRSYILGDWKVLASTNVNDGMYYEITYDHALKVIYFDAYKRWENKMIAVD